MSLTVAALMACASLLYATAGQAGGTAFLAIMAFGGFPAAEMRPTALLLNIIAAGYATWLLQRRAILDWKMLAKLVVPSLATAFSGGLLVLTDVAYAFVTGLLLILAAILMVVRRMADRVEARPIGFLPVALAGAGAGFVLGSHRCRRGRFPYTSSGGIKVVFAEGRGGDFSTLHPLQLDRRAGRCLVVWAAICPLVATLRD